LLAPVFEAMLANATRICEAKFGFLILIENGEFRNVALHNSPREFADWVARNPIVPLPIRRDLEIPLVRLARTKQLVHVPDITRRDRMIHGK
jgi:hypothetical protein